MMSSAGKVMNGPGPGPSEMMAAAPGVADGVVPVWERPWTLAEMRGGSNSWSLASDASLLLYMQEFSQQLIARTHEMEREMERLLGQARGTDCRLRNTFNDFLSLAHTQFIENRVYDEEVEEVPTKTEPAEKPDQAKREAELIPRIRQAVQLGLHVLDGAFETLDAKGGAADSDSEEDEAVYHVEPILEPKDPYLDRPLPHIIGSQQFLSSDDVGLADISSDEEAADSDRESASDAESDEGLPNGNPSEGTTESDEESEGDKRSFASRRPENGDPSYDGEESEPDIFGHSDEEEPERRAGAASRPPRPTVLFPDDRTSKLPRRKMSVDSEDRSSNASGESAARRRHPERTPGRRDMMAAPEDEDEESPFASTRGMFSGGRGLFDDDEEGGGLFDEEVRNEEKTVPVPAETKKDRTLTKSGKKIPAGAVSLFPGEGIFVPPKPQPVAQEVPKVVQSQPEKKPASTLFSDDEEGDLFAGIGGAGKQTKAAAEAPRTKPSQGLFADEDVDTDGDDGGGLFGFKPPSTKTLPSRTDTAKVSPAPSQQSKPSTQPLKPKVTSSLFDDDDDESDLFSAAPTQKPSNEGTKPKATAGLFSDDEDLWDSASKPRAKVEKPQALAAGTSPAAPVAPKAPSQAAAEPASPAMAAAKPPAAKPRAGTGLFDDDDEGDDDLFSVAAPKPASKPGRASLLFEDNADDSEGGPALFAASQPPAAPEAARPPAPSHTKTKGQPLEAHWEEDEDRLPPPLTSSVPKPGTAKPKVLSLFDSDDEDGNDRGADGGHGDFVDGGAGRGRLFGAGVKKPQPAPRVNTADGAGAKQPPATKAAKPGVFDDEEFLFSRSREQEGEPDVDLFTKSGKNPSELPTPSLPPSKSKPPSTAIGKLQASLAIDPAKLLPDGPKPKPRPPLTSSHQPANQEAAGAVSVKSSPGSGPEEATIGFERPAQADTLHSLGKNRAKVGGNRRPPTRTGRRLSSEKSDEPDGPSTSTSPSLSLSPSEDKDARSRPSPLIAGPAFSPPPAVPADVPSPLQGVASMPSQSVKPGQGPSAESWTPAKAGANAVSAVALDEGLKKPAASKPPKSLDMFLSDEDDELFGGSKARKPAVITAQQTKSTTGSRPVLSDDDDLFAPLSKPSKAGAEEEGPSALFGSSAKVVGGAKALGIGSDDPFDFDDLFGDAPKASRVLAVQQQPKVAQSPQPTAATATTTSTTAAEPHSKSAADALDALFQDSVKNAAVQKKAALLDDEDDDDLFAGLTKPKSVQPGAKISDPAESSHPPREEPEDKIAVVPEFESQSYGTVLFGGARGSEDDSQRKDLTFSESDDDDGLFGASTKKVSEARPKSGSKASATGIAQDDIFGGVAKAKPKSHTPKNVFLDDDDDADIFGDIFPGPGSKTKKAAASGEGTHRPSSNLAKPASASVFDADFDDIFVVESSAVSKKTTPSRPAEPKKDKVDTIFTDPLNALGGP
uniref:WASH complex subunit 2A-like isoform X2 n=1 Tax=Petromyzon marinus TaxID=7757 RepID=A0AAJ7TN97_PETMA|nr:WASH complex subunit 2A-like isoform X2 [Petromyzon marinus]